MAKVGLQDSKAFAELMDRHLSRAVNIAARALNSRTDAEEIAQEAFIRVWCSAPKWLPIDAGGKASFSAWLHRIIINLVIDKKRRKALLPLDESHDPADDAEDSFGQLYQREISDTVTIAIRRLPERQRMALTLCFFEGKSNIEAGQLLGATAKSIESLLVRARRSLKRDLKSAYVELSG